MRRHDGRKLLLHVIDETENSAVFVRPTVSAEQRGVASIEDVPPNEFLPPTTLTDKAHSRLQGLITLLDSCLTLPDNCADHIISLLEALSIVGRYRPQLLPKILDVFERLVGQDPWLDTLLSFHTRVFLATPLDGDYHAKCVHVLKRIDPTSAGSALILVFWFAMLVSVYLLCGNGSCTPAQVRRCSLPGAPKKGAPKRAPG